MSSSLENAVEKGLKIAQNIDHAWITADYYDKQRLQYLIFPDGMKYAKKNNRVLTTRVNTLFEQIGNTGKHFSR